MSAAKALNSSVLVKDIMIQPVCTINAQMKLWEVAEMFIGHKISGAPVVDSAGRVITVMGEGVTLRLAATEGLDATIAHCLPKMTPATQIIKVLPTDTFADAYKLFLKHGVHRLPVVDGNGHLKGIISRSMILKIFVEAHYGRPLPKSGT